MLVCMVLVNWLLLFAWYVSVFVLIVYIGRFSSWLECYMVLWMGCSMGGG